MQKEKKFISVVVYLHNVEKYMEYFLDKVLPVYISHFQEFEIVCVDVVFQGYFFKNPAFISFFHRYTGFCISPDFVGILVGAR